MLIIGAKGFAKEVLEVLTQLNDIDNVCFFDDVNVGITQLYDKFHVFKSIEVVDDYFKEVDNRFTIGIGNPRLRKQLFEKFTALGGKYVSTISPFARIGSYGNKIGPGCNIMTGTVITNDVELQQGVLVNLNCTIGHDCVIGAFVEISPGTSISGNCSIGDYSVLGTNATILPKVAIGTNVIVAAGAVVTKDVPDNCMVAGIPAIIKKELPKLEW